MKSPKTIAIQGISGSFHHQVALNFFDKDSEILGCKTFEKVAKMVFEEKVDFGVIAIENSIAGAILPNYDLIDRYSLGICEEYYLPIAHQLMALPGQRLEDLTEVQSHPMALLQCITFLAKWPEIDQIDGMDTASVAKEISESKTKKKAAIASKIAADIYDLEILAKDIQTERDNFTRFIILQKETVNLKEEHNKASFKVTIKNEKGGLAELLTSISAFGLNLSKIQSIPVIDKPWEYAFFMDAEFEKSSDFEAAAKAIQSNFGQLKLFGAYIRRKE